MNVLGANDDEIEILTQNIQPTRTRYNSLTESTQNEIIIPKKSNLQNKKPSSYGNINKKQHNFIEQKPVVLNHVTLTLNVLDKSANVLPTWKYNTIRRTNNLPLNNQNINLQDKHLYTNDKSSKKYYHNSFFLTSCNQVESFESSLSNSENQFNNKLPVNYRVKSSKKLSSEGENERVQNSNSTSETDSVYNVETFQKNQTKNKAYPTSAMSSQKSYDSRPKTAMKNFYIDTTRVNLGSSLSSNDSARNSGRHTYSVSEFNRFKNNLLKSSQRLELDFYRQQKTGIQPTIKSNGVPSSAIKSIYEAVEREKRLKTTSVDVRRSNYFNTITKTRNYLSNSLMIKKI
ncbi:unnamed protein product [Brachionus calyciflorus]|uniref:Uncharacterized protein n=1 Tax=Brachionus calyciflorus TaxID=104777 RepID=A0A813PZK2_9BILA|nr:unnamed protein product [Brachionus calyciflorus]